MTTRSSRTNFPGVVLLKNIPHREHPLGRYLPGSNTIEMAAEELRKHDIETRRFAVYHEIGHFWSVVVVENKKVDSDEEIFANVFATYFLAPTKLASIDYLFMKECFVANDAEKIEVFASDVFKKLEAALWKV